MRRWSVVVCLTLLPTLSVAEGTKVETHSSSTYTFYESNGARVYFSEEFLKGFMEVTDVTLYKTEFSRLIGQLLESGSLTGEMLLEEMGNTDPGIVNLSDDDVARFAERSGVYESMKNFEGQVIKILYVQLKKGDGRAGRQEYELWVTPSIWETGWGEFHIFNVVLDIRSGVEAELVELQYLGMQI